MDKNEKTIQLTNHPIAKGDSVLAPNDWVTINPHDAESSHYAGVVEVKNGAEYEAPHFLFFSKRPIRELSDEETESVLSAAEAIWPRLKEVRENEIELLLDEDGRAVNGPEYDKAPLVGVFSICDEGTYPFCTPPYGAVVVRKSEGAEQEGEK